MLGRTFHTTPLYVIPLLGTRYSRSPLASSIQDKNACSALQHSNVCTISTTEATGDGRPFNVMDYVDVETLRQKS